ncbi:hypothetical protein [Limnohabitans radicicola]|uniref:Uncharacterized protein n=1 Tax=Limnohabitans radicicola TaxID=2771427 RepID=A0A927IJU9_9BURK|nr:hypothetical protein [Limnohabitans radicicola]MBD8048968.1 hypothetical protein [Limnohabitans radicicola]
MTTRKTVLVIFPDEITAGIAKFPWLAKEANWLCLSIDALDRCLQLQLPHAQMPTWLQATGTFSADEHRYVYSKLQCLEESFIEQRNSMGFNEHAYWNHQHNLTQLTLFSSAQKTAALAVENLSKSVPLLMLQRVGVGDYHFPGGLLTAIIQDKLQRAGFQTETIYLPLSQLISTYAPTVYSQIPNYWSADVSQKWQESDSNVVISPSGLFYKSDQKKLLHLIKKLGVTTKTWMLSPPFWNVIPDGTGFKDRVSVQSAYENLSPSMQQALMAMVEGMTASTDEVMQEILGDQMERLDLYQHQIQQIKQRHLFQCLTFLGMAHLCSIKKMDALIVSNLDGGINGSLFSAAQDASSPCYMLPHSHVINQASEGPCTVITEYWQPQPSMSHRGAVNIPVYLPTELNLDSTMDLWSAPRPQKVVVLFNGIHRWTALNTGLSFFKKTLTDIVEICSNEGCELAYRLKPGDQTPLDAFCHLLELDRELCQKGIQEPLDVLLRNTELVIAIDDPSSALWEALELGCAVILIANRPFISSTLLDGNILESFSPEQGLELIAQVLSDKNQLDQLRLTQFAKLLALRESRLTN